MLEPCRIVGLAPLLIERYIAIDILGNPVSAKVL